MKITTRERRDWTLLIFIIPIGIIFMMIAGQIAIRIVPQWSVNAGMQSQLDPATAPKQQVSLVQPVLPEILTPLGWLETFLTPNSDSGDDIVFPPFIVLEPTATPSPTASPTDTASPTVTETPTTPVSPSPTVVTTVPTATPTKKPPADTPTPPTICTDPLATNFNGPLPCTYPPTTCTDPLATNVGGPLPCTYPPTTCTDPLATNVGGPLPCTYPPPPIASTIDPSLSLVAPPPDLDIDMPPDGNPGDIDPGVSGAYVVIGISTNPVIVGNTPDGNYDLVYYEWANGSSVFMDSIILGISQLADGSIYYEVFNWGNNIPDTNTNADTNNLPADANPACVTPECEDRDIPTSELYPDPGAGILIDVDNASSAPPAGTYDYLVIISPLSGGPDPAQVDAIVVTEVPIP